MIRSQVRREPRRGRSTAVLVLAGALVGSGEPAFAARASSGAVPQIVSVTTAPQAVVLSGPKKHKSGLTIRMRVSDPTGVDSVFAGIYAPQGDAGRALRLKHVSGSVRDGIWQAKGNIPADGAPGSWRIQAFAVDTAQRSSDANDIYGNFSVRRASRFENFVVDPAVSPETVDLHATLQRWDGHGWVPATLAPVLVQFRATGQTTYGTVETVRSGSDGAVAVSERTGVANGFWRLSYTGDDTTAASDSPDGTVTAPAPVPTPAPTVRPASTGTAAPTASPRAVPSDSPAAETTPTATPRAIARPTGRPQAADLEPTLAPQPRATATPTADPGIAPTPAPTSTSTPSTTADPAPRRAGRRHPAGATRTATPYPGHGGTVPGEISPRRAGRARRP